ncbi:hypothetical protein RHGRI_005653 [Rhododendron griersonianum]|uniref:Ribosomal protein S12 n=1 Tax=Rhododendron griersonianum TaxID=479676 RepID=A0AAV6LE75_9ERIC|nr:hypothetical protein RHGRI_005653 [Rhododendron griersonianum]
MRRWTAFQGEPKPTPNPATTEDPTNSSLRCGKWLLRSTKIRRSRGKYTRNRTVSSIFVVSIRLGFSFQIFIVFNRCGQHALRKFCFPKARAPDQGSASVDGKRSEYKVATRV